jgi:hypothetical protein
MARARISFGSEIPRGRILVAPLKLGLHRFGREFGRGLALFCILLPGGLCIEWSEASSPNYGSLFFECMVLGAIHVPLAILFFIKVKHYTRWIALFCAVSTTLFLSEFAYRILFGG